MVDSGDLFLSLRQNHTAGSYHSGDLIWGKEAVSMFRCGMHEVYVRCRPLGLRLDEDWFNLSSVGEIAPVDDADVDLYLF